MTSGGAGAFATEEEAGDALRALSRSELAKLNALAKVRALQVPGLDWRDLLHDAVDKVLTGKRQWPIGLPILVFMREVMRSLASECRRKARDGFVTIEADLPQNEDGETAFSLGHSEGSNPELEVHSKRVLAEVLDRFAGDSEVLAILEGLSLGLRPEEVRARHGLTKTQFESAQKRLRRSIIRNYPNGQDQ